MRATLVFYSRVGPISKSSWYKGFDQYIVCAAEFQVSLPSSLAKLGRSLRVLNCFNFVVSVYIFNDTCYESGRLLGIGPVSRTPPRRSVRKP